MLSVAYSLVYLFILGLGRRGGIVFYACFSSSFIHERKSGRCLFVEANEILLSYFNRSHIYY